MMGRVSARYLSRLAVIYLRQSTERQVRCNEGSRQYQEEQVEMARRFGWAPERILVLRGDLGLSGMSRDRPDYKRLLGLIEACEVGGLFIADVSRAGREERAWFDLLDLLIIYDVLLIKGGVLTDPNDESAAFTTKLEALIVRRENQLRLANLHRGRLAKARMGKAVSAPPVGYVASIEKRDGVDVNSGFWDKDPDLAVREATEAVFTAFRETRSLRKAVDWLNARGLKLPARRGVPSGRARGVPRQ